MAMDEYGNDDGWTSNYDENAYYSPDEQQQSVASVSEDSLYDLPNTYGYDTPEDNLYDLPNTYGYDTPKDNQYYNYGQTSSPDETMYDKLGLTPNQSTLPNSQPNWFTELLAGNGNNPMPQARVPNVQQGGISSILASLFGGGTKIAAASMEGRQNKQKQQALNKIAASPQQDPFGSQRPFYQQQAQQVVTNPYSSPIVKAQIDNVQREQNIKDAAAGRRSNMIASQPGVMAQQAKIAQSYLDQMLHAGGSQIAPNGNTIANLQTGAANAGINGYASPLASAIGYNTSSSNNNNDALANAIKLLASSRGNQ